VRILSGEDSVWVGSSEVRIQHRISDLGNDLAADYIKQQLKTYNLTVSDQIYSASGRNIYAIQPGLIYPEKQYIICAHYDAVDNYCADDNASGVAAVLEAARILSQYYFKYTLVYALWDEEEIGFLGSQYFASQAHSNQADIMGVVNIDMIGWDGNEDGLFDIHTNNIANSNSIANTLIVVDALYNISLEPVIYNPGTWQSDHDSFWGYDYGAVMLIEAFYGEDLNPYYHSSEDRINKFDLAYFQNLTRLTIGAITTLIESTQDTLITMIVPDKAYQNSTLEMMVYGYQTNFADSVGSLNVWLSQDFETIIADSIFVQSDTSLIVFFSIPLSATSGFWDVNVNSSVDGILTMEGGFEILPLPKVINVPADISSIQDAIDIANDGDTVLVQPGIYMENINFNGKNIVVGSLILTTDDNGYISQTIIDGNKQGRVVDFISGEDSTTVLNGFTITNGLSHRRGQANGAGIYLDNGSCPKLLNLIVTGNVGNSANGAGICCWNNSNCLIENVMVTNNDGSGNVSTNDGSGGILLMASSPVLRNVIIANNIGVMAGGLFCHGNSNPVLINVTIANNKVSGSDWWDDVAEVVCWNDGNPVFINSIISNDSQQAILLRENNAGITIAHSNIQGGVDGIATFNSGIIHWLEGNMDTNPMFADTAHGDFRLKEGSPCIDKGIQNTFIVYNDGNDTLYIPPMDYVGAAPDMGAYEYGDPTSVKHEVNFVLYQYTLHQNYPNPFNPSTKIKFQIQNSKFTTLKIFNILGEEVAVLVSKKLNSGNHTYQFDGKNLASGIYYYQLMAGEFQDVKKMILLK
jgi:hypothetical protein